MNSKTRQQEGGNDGGKKKKMKNKCARARRRRATCAGAGWMVSGAILTRSGAGRDAWRGDKGDLGDRGLGSYASWASGARWARPFFQIFRPYSQSNYAILYCESSNYRPSSAAVFRQIFSPHRRWINFH
jgi:hypothetical protein